MTMSQPTSTLSKPSNADPIPLGTFGYFRARNKDRIYELVVKEFQKSGLTQADLARRMSKKPEVICRLLGAPGNWTLDTVSDLLFAISGAEPAYQVSYPLDQPNRNFVQPDWLTPDFSWVEKHQLESANQQFPAARAALIDAAIPTSGNQPRITQ